MHDCLNEGKVGKWFCLFSILPNSNGNDSVFKTCNSDLPVGGSVGVAGTVGVGVGVAAISHRVFSTSAASGYN